MNVRELCVMRANFVPLPPRIPAPLGPSCHPPAPNLSGRNKGNIAIPSIRSQERPWFKRLFLFLLYNSIFSQCLHLIGIGLSACARLVAIFIFDLESISILIWISCCTCLSTPPESYDPGEFALLLHSKRTTREIDRVRAHNQA